MYIQYKDEIVIMEAIECYINWLNDEKKEIDEPSEWAAFQTKVMQLEKIRDDILLDNLPL